MKKEKEEKRYLEDWPEYKIEIHKSRGWGFHAFLYRRYVGLLNMEGDRVCTIEQAYGIVRAYSVWAFTEKSAYNQVRDWIDREKKRLDFDSSNPRKVTYV